MGELTRRINRVLGRTVGLQVIRGRTRSVLLNPVRFTKILYFDDLLSRIDDVPGDVVECGVADGSSLAVLASLLRARGAYQERHIWGFDAWAGLPPPTEADLSYASSIAKPGMFKHASTRRVLEELAAYGWTRDAINQRITLVPGFFEDTLPSFDRKIALLHIDADLYESYRSCLYHLWTNVQAGGVVAFDEYEDVERWPGARRAVDEFLASLAPGAASLTEDRRSQKWWVQKGP